ncbi:MAG TPA: hypothetical protein VGM90_07515 [Kofleriaceae bacterium]|jgi:hypothetical protein
MSKPWTLVALALLTVAACHDADKDRGTCIKTLKVEKEVYEQCVVNEFRYQCQKDGLHPAAAFTLEATPAGQARCKGAGYVKLARVAHSCDGSPSDRRMDDAPDGSVSDALLETAIQKNCALQYEQPDAK